MTVTMQHPETPAYYSATQCVSLKALSNSPSAARVFVAQTLERWNLPGCVDNAQLLASELVTNAIKAVGMINAYPTPSYIEIRKAATVSLCLYRHGGLLVIEVWDPKLDPPKPVAAGPYDLSGRGLEIVLKIATAYGYRWPKTKLGGKVVWCSIKTV